jgi:signal transduction histidine kinase
MRYAADVGRQALGDMRTVIGVLRTDSATADLGPQPGLGDLGSLLGRVRATGLVVDLSVEGQAFTLGPAAELSVYRIIQESLTNTLKHAAATRAQVGIEYDRPVVAVTVTDDGAVKSGCADTQWGGHGIAGMRERAALHRGSLEAGPTGRGWVVTASLRPEANLATQ